MSLPAEQEVQRARRQYRIGTADRWAPNRAAERRHTEGQETAEHEGVAAEPEHALRTCHDAIGTR